MATTATASTTTHVSRSRERLLTPMEAAELLTLQPSTLAEYRTHGKGPRFIRLSRNTVRYKLTDLLDFIHSQESVNPKEER